MNRITDLAAASSVVQSTRHCGEFDCREVPCPVPLDAAQVVAFPQVPGHAVAAAGRGDVG